MWIVKIRIIMSKMARTWCCQYTERVETLGLCVWGTCTQSQCKIFQNPALFNSIEMFSVIYKLLKEGLSIELGLFIRIEGLIFGFYLEYSLDLSNGDQKTWKGTPAYTFLWSLVLGQSTLLRFVLYFLDWNKTFH